MKEKVDLLERLDRIDEHNSLSAWWCKEAAARIRRQQALLIESRDYCNDLFAELENSGVPGTAVIYGRLRRFIQKIEEELMDGKEMNDG